MQVDRLDNDEFIDFLWNKFQLHKNKVKAQQELQELVLASENNTWKPGPDIKMIGMINGHEKVSMIKDSVQRQWAILNKKLRDIEREERGGFIINFHNANIQKKE